MASLGPIRPGLETHHIRHPRHVLPPGAWTLATDKGFVMCNHRLLVAAAAVVLTASSFAAADSLDDIQRRGVLRWGGDDSGGGPYIYEDKDHKLTGFEFELAQYLAGRLGVRSQFVNSEWEMLPQLLDRGDIDVVLNGYEWSNEREASWSSTVPYYIYKLQLMARKDDQSIRSWNDLRASLAGRASSSVRSAILPPSATSDSSLTTRWT